MLSILQSEFCFDFLILQHDFLNTLHSLSSFYGTLLQLLWKHSIWKIKPCVKIFFPLNVMLDFGRARFQLLGREASPGQKFNFPWSLETRVWVSLVKLFHSRSAGNTQLPQISSLHKHRPSGILIHTLIKWRLRDPEKFTSGQCRIQTRDLLIFSQTSTNVPCNTILNWWVRAKKV